MRVLTSESVLKTGKIFVSIKPPNHFLGKTTHFDLFFKAVDQFIMLSYRIRLIIADKKCFLDAMVQHVFYQ